MTAEEIQTQIENLRDRIEELEDNRENLVRERDELEVEVGDLKIDIDQFDRSEYASEDLYDVWLDEMDGLVSVAGLQYQASDILKQVDPIAYRTGFNDYVDTLRDEDFQEYCDMVENRDELDESIEDLNDQIENLDGHIDELQSQIENLEDDLAELEDEE